MGVKVYIYIYISISSEKQYLEIFAVVDFDFAPSYRETEIKKEQAQEER